MRKIIRSPFEIHDPVSPPIFAGREEELDFINEAILMDRENLIIHGVDGIGKSSILKTIFCRINEDNNKFLSIEINARDIISGFEKDFLSFITHKICMSIWTELMKKRYSELIHDVWVDSQKEGLVEKFKPEERALKRIYKIVTNSELANSGTVNKEIGLGNKLLMKGSVSKSKSVDYQRKPLEPFEFLALLKELNDIVMSFKFDSIIVFCDEMNHLPDKVNIDIIRSYFSIFTSNQIQFLIVAINPKRFIDDYEYDFTEAFNYQLEVSPFGNASSVKALIENCLSRAKSSIPFQEDGHDLLFEKYEGHPWWIQKGADFSYKLAIEGNKEIVSNDLILKSLDFFANDFEFYKDITKKGKPYRKKYFKYSI